MRKSREETARTRARIVDNAARTLRTRGIRAAAVPTLMAEAGLTHGGFYRHFESKDELVAEACAAAIRSLAERMDGALTSTDGGLAAAARYLSPAHRDRPGDGCPLAALGSELARLPHEDRAVVTAAVRDMIAVLARPTTGVSRAAAEDRALAALATMVGAVTLARIVSDPKMSDAILRSARRTLSARQ